VRVPLSWLRDFAPFPAGTDEGSALSAVLDDLGLVVEGVELVGEGLGDVVVVRIDEVTPIAGADRIRRVVVDAGQGPVEVVCGATNFAVGDLVALAPVGAVLPGGFAIGRRKMKGVVSNGMLCSGRELGLSEDHDGILILNEVTGVAVGHLLVDALGIEPDVVFDIAVEANRPDAWSMAGVARDLAARLGLPFSIPDTLPAASDAGPGGPTGPGSGPTTIGTEPIDRLASIRVDDQELCPRFTGRVITGVTVAPSPEWIARRLTLAGMRPINNVVDASNYVMLELGQPTHPYDLDRLPGKGLVVRRAEPGETVTTLDGVERTLGRPGPGLGDTGQDCLICDAEGEPVAIGGVMGGASSEISDATTRILLEAAYFVPMAIARTSKRLNLRTEASARFERGCDPVGIERAANRFVQLLAVTAGAEMKLAPGAIDLTADVPLPVELTLRPSKVNGLLGSSFDGPEIIGLLAPLGIVAEPVGAPDDDTLSVTVPTYRPDVRPAPMGEADIAEEVARIYGYSRISRRTPSWPQPGRLTAYQKDRRRLREVLCGVGATEAWTEAFVSGDDQRWSGLEPPYIEVTNPLVEAEPFLRSSMVPGLLRALRYNAERRQGDLRLFEIGSTFERADGGTSGGAASGGAVGAHISERMSAVFTGADDDAWAAVAAWRTIADAMGLVGWTLGEQPVEGPSASVVHPYRSAAIHLLGSPPEAVGTTSPSTLVGVVGELAPALVSHFGLVNPDGRPRRVGWLDMDMGLVLDPSRVARRAEESLPISRFPSSDIDLAFVVPDNIAAGSVERTLRQAGGELLESLSLFDVYRGPSLAAGTRSLAFHLRFCSLDHTLTDDEVGTLRSGCIQAVERGHSASLR
jgi:phenylalanyl-tRNA synthetase beta chain